MKQRTIAKPVEVVGIGLHKGVAVKLRLEPLEPNSGIVFYREDKMVSIPLEPNSVTDTKMATTIAKSDANVSTIEHFMSAVYAYGIDNLRVIIDNNELPILDGSSISFCMLLNDAGIIEQEKSKKVMKITKKVEIHDGEKFASIEPSDKLIFDFKIDFNHPVISKQEYRFEFTKDAYVKEIAKARTFGFLQEVQYLRSIGLALGGSLENAIVLDDSKILNPEGLRFSTEFVRHKILDAIGDLSLLSMPIIGEYKAFASSHHLNHLLTKKILEEEAFEIIEEEQTEEVKEFAKDFSVNI
jgi:UDP-3-O-[3-hydroxymyristoyl] N-acetylglucosamine deacetylase